MLLYLPSSLHLLRCPSRYCSPEPKLSPFPPLVADSLNICRYCTRRKRWALNRVVEGMEVGRILFRWLLELWIQVCLGGMLNVVREWLRAPMMGNFHAACVDFEEMRRKLRAFDWLVADFVLMGDGCKQGWWSVWHLEWDIMDTGLWGMPSKLISLVSAQCSDC